MHFYKWINNCLLQRDSGQINCVGLGLLTKAVAKLLTAQGTTGPEEPWDCVDDSLEAPLPLMGECKLH
eukprot:scaffold497635_cov50-Prasinocladus_malaysianus.AAC.1